MNHHSARTIDYGALVAQRDRNQFRLERQVAQFEEEVRNVNDDPGALDALYHRLLQTRQRVKELQAQLASDGLPQRQQS